jgi:hypothetical protein
LITKRQGSQDLGHEVAGQVVSAMWHSEHSGVAQEYGLTTD